MIIALAIVSACVLSVMHTRAGGITVPAILLIASLTLWPTSASYAPSTLQRVVGVYLCMIPVSGLATVSVSVQVSGRIVMIAVSLILAVILTLGHLVSRVSPDISGAGQDDSPVLLPWLSAIGILAVHLAILWSLLRVWYGHGWERSLVVFGLACLYCFAFRFLWDALSDTVPRRCICLALCAYYSCLVGGLG